jgi:hypothetical protein
MTLDSRKAAMTTHPDKGGSEAKMAQVNEAYEVLSNPGKQLCIINTFVLLAQLIFTEFRQRFNNGDDPNDPGSQGGAPFTGYGSPFGGGFGGGGDHPFAQFSSRLGSAGSRLVEAIDDLIFSISQSGLECTVALLHRTALSRLRTVTATLSQSDRLWCGGGWSRVSLSFDCIVCIFRAPTSELSKEDAVQLCLVRISWIPTIT